MPIASSLALTIAATMALPGVVPVKDEQGMRPTAVLWPAPVGHRQPTLQDLPPNLRRDEGARTKSESAFDKSLQICRGC